MSRPTDTRLDPPEKALIDGLIDAVDALLTRCNFLAKKGGVPESLRSQLQHLAFIREEIDDVVYARYLVTPSDDTEAE